MGKLTPITLSALLAASCWEGPPPLEEPDAAPPVGGVVELGTGALAFEPLLAEQELGLIAGPQGGFHFIVHARIREMAPGDPEQPVTTPSTRFFVYTEDGTRIDKMTPAYRIAYESAEEGWFVLPGGRICQVENEAVPAMYGARVRIRVEVRDEIGRIAWDERWVVVFDHCERYPMDCEFG